MKKLTLLLLLLLPFIVIAKHIHPERYYQKVFADSLANAKVEVIAPDKTRCDILTEEYAIEVDFAKKWAEAIGQSLNYSIQFNKKAGIVLILENSKDYKYYIRLNTIIKHFNLKIKVWTIKP